MTENKKVLLSRPKDESLEAFKEWMTEFIKHLKGQDWEVDVSEDAWVKYWKKFYRGKETKD